jgi:guanylate kinase
VVRRLIERDPTLAYSVSATTRPPRPGEEDGRDYVFLTPERFAELVGEDAFLEHAEVFGHRYGTLSGPVEQHRREGPDVLLEIDVQGARAGRNRAPDAVLIFLRPPSVEELERRLRRRGTEDPEALRGRLAAAAEEMEQAAWFDHVVENAELERAVDEVAAIIERYRNEPRPGPHERLPST